MTAPIPPDVVTKLRTLIRSEVQQAMSSAPTRNMASGPFSVREGEVRMAYPPELGGTTAVYVGPLVRTDTNAYNGNGLLVQAPDGTDMAVFRTDAQFGTTQVNLYDSGNRIIVGNDAASAQGLARPYIPGGGFGRARYADWTVFTTSDVFETLWATRMVKQHPRLEVGVRASSDASVAAGEVRVLVNGAPLGATQAVGFGQGYYIFGPDAVAGAHMATLDVEVQARRTSASGAVRVEPWHAPLGRQSP